MFSGRKIVHKHSKKKSSRSNKKYHKSAIIDFLKRNNEPSWVIKNLEAREKGYKKRT